MKSGSQTESRGVKASSKCGIKKGSTGFNKARKTTSRQSNQARGKDKVLSNGKENCSPAKVFGGNEAELPRKVSLLTEKTSSLPVIDLYPRHTLPSEKIKIQLFPINVGTRMRLEKDGHNPYLELTLRAGKKISSVIKHFHCKWGSCAAVGEPMLFQYNAVDNISSCKRWTLNDSKLTAGDVYAAIGKPPIFRLRYGWLSSYELGNYTTPYMSPLQYCFENGGIEGYNGKTVAKYDDGVNDNVASKTSAAKDTCQATDEVADENIADLPVNPLDNDSRGSIGLGQFSELLVDGSTNISIGGLLSEASLMGKLNNYGPKTFDGKIGLETNQIIWDSLDAFISSHASPIQRSEDHRSSILDADETCHGFPLQKISSSIKDAPAIVTITHSRSCSRDGVKSSNLYSSKKVDDQGVADQKVIVEGSGVDLLLNRQINEDERSLGLTDIKWAESLGPFDLGLPTKKLTRGDSVSFTGFVR